MMRRWVDRTARGPGPCRIESLPPHTTDPLLKVVIAIGTAETAGSAPPARRVEP